VKENEITIEKEKVGKKEEEKIEQVVNSIS